jgi:hypothetical protein
MTLVRNTFLLFAVCLASASIGQINVKPVITGQSSVKTGKNIPITVQFSHLIVFDIDDPYPVGFTLKLYSGNKFTFQGTTVTPEKDFVGTLTVPVTVNDGQDESNKFNLKIQVENVPPVITGQQPLSVRSGEKITLELSNLFVTDPDDNYPADFTLSVSTGSNYTLSGRTVTPNPNFVGTLTVPVSVNDGNNASAKFNLKITVLEKVNIPPLLRDKIHYQQPKTILLSSSLITLL